MVKKNTKNKSRVMLFLVILLITADLVFLFFAKYHNQNLSLKDFNLKNLGNIINLSFSLLLIFGVLLDYFRENLSLKSKSFFTFLILTQFFLVAAYLSIIISLPFKGIYFLGQNGNRLLIATLFTLFNFFNFVTIFIVWHFVLKTQNLIVLRSILNATVLMLIILVTVFFYILKKETGYKDYVKKSGFNNIGVVLGAAVWSNNKPSPSLSARVDKAIALYEKGEISEIYLTGSNAPGELSESEVALNYIKSSGKNIPKIYLEKETTSTIEQIEFVKKKLLTDPKNKIIIISDRYHLVRVQEIGKFHNINFRVVPSSLSQSFEASIYSKIRESLALTVFWFCAV